MLYLMGFLRQVVFLEFENYPMFAGAKMALFLVLIFYNENDW